MLLTPASFAAHALEGLDLVREEQDILKDIWKSTRDTEKEEAVAKVAKKLLASNSCLVWSAEWSLTNSILYFLGKVYVSNHSDLWWQIRALCHDTRVA